MIVNTRLVQEIMAYAAIVMGVLTQAVPGITLPTVASAILGAFGIILHPLTSVNASVSTSVLPANKPEQPTRIGGVS